MYKQMHRIADEMEQAIASGMTADEAEEMAIKRINELGRAMLTDWAKARHEQSVEEVRQEKPSAIRDAKKN
jgi:CheY-specific phosphatase CheX